MSSILLLGSYSFETIPVRCRIVAKFAVLPTHGLSFWAASRGHLGAANPFCFFNMPSQFSRLDFHPVTFPS
jgi:hypothetical protein